MTDNKIAFCYGLEERYNNSHSSGIISQITTAMLNSLQRGNNDYVTVDWQNTYKVCCIVSRLAPKQGKLSKYACIEINTSVMIRCLAQTELNNTC